MKNDRQNMNRKLTLVLLAVVVNLISINSVFGQLIVKNGANRKKSQILKKYFFSQKKVLPLQKKIIMINIFYILFLIFVFCTINEATAQYQSFFGSESTGYSFVKHEVCYSKDSDCDTTYNPLLDLGCSMAGYLAYRKNDTIAVNDTIYYYAYDDYYLREDTIEGKLYVRFVEWSLNIGDHLICDMSLNVGDTFYLPQSFSLFDDRFRYMIADSINYINGRKIIYFNKTIHAFGWGVPYGYDNSCFDDILTVKFVEGIGASYFPVQRFLLVPSLLLCVHKDDTLSFMANPIFGCEQNCPFNNIKYNEKSELKTTIMDNQLQINFPEDINVQHGELFIFDAVGHSYYNKGIKNNPEYINISHLTSGMYILLYSNGENKLRTKFVKP